MQGEGAALVVDGISHFFGQMRALDDITLDIRAGELVAFLGPSGCGKTTLLRIIAGFIAQSAGRILVDGAPVDDLQPNRRGVGIVFQNYALFPHMTVSDNVAYGLAARGTGRAETRARVQEMLDLVQLGHLAKRYPKQLSGGQQQRVALARALAVQPRLLLLDEPFGALDKNLRLDMQIEIKRLQRQFGITTILVTHDQEEALSMADRIAVFNKGVLEQFGSPTDIYDRPSSLFVNTFVGTANLLPGKVERLKGAEAYIRLAGGATLLGAPLVPLAGPGMPITLSVRPENLRLEAEGAEGRIPGRIEVAMPLGPVVVYEVRLNDGALVKATEPRVPGGAPRPIGMPVHLAPSSTEAAIIIPNP